MLSLKVCLTGSVTDGGGDSGHLEERDLPHGDAKRLHPWLDMKQAGAYNIDSFCWTLCGAGARPCGT
jgi:hypothetical protein